MYTYQKVHSHVIYHANCCDGMGAAYAVWQAAVLQDWVHAPIMTPMSYGQEPSYLPRLHEDEVLYIVDFSFPRSVLLKLCEIYARVILLDHHKTAIDDLGTWTSEEGKPDNLTLVLDTNRSGARIAWDYFHEINAPLLILYIEDRDLWRHSLPYTQEVNAAIALTEKCIEDYRLLAHDLQHEFNKIKAQGQVLVTQQERHLAEIIKATKRPCNINGKEGLVCNCPGQFASDVGNILAKESGTYGATYYAAADGSHKWSLRSIGDYDVSAIAKLFGGGGHRNAAGFSLAPGEISSDGVTLWTRPPVDDFPDDYEV